MRATICMWLFILTFEQNIKTSKQLQTAQCLDVWSWGYTVQHSTATVPRPGLWSFWSYECQIIYIVKCLVIWIEMWSQEMLTRPGKVPIQHLQSISHKRRSTSWSTIGSLLLELSFDSAEIVQCWGLWEDSTFISGKMCFTFLFIFFFFFFFFL